MCSPGRGPGTAPHHYGCHAQALQYLCEKWYGSHKEMFAFAERAADKSLPASRLQALPRIAAVGYVTESPVTEVIPEARTEAAIARAQRLSARYALGDREVAECRDCLAFLLARRRRWSEAAEQLRLTGVHATSLPWVYLDGEDPRRAFLGVRKRVGRQVAVRSLFSRAGA
jgi:hypothetical protein